MSNEYLEALETLKTALHNEWLRFYPQFKELKEMTKFVDGVRMVGSDAEAFLTVKQALQRLEQIEKNIEICKKANEQKFVYIKESYGIIKEKFLDDLDYEFFNDRLYVCARGMYYDFPLKDYCNWWALTKEELE